MPRELLRFPLPAADQARVDPATVVVGDDPFDPHRFRLSVRLTDPSGPAPTAAPPFSGTVYFVADPAADGVVPTVDGTGALTPADPAQWRRRGTLLVVADNTTRTGLDGHVLDLAILPSVAWIGPVELPTTFNGALADSTLIARSTLIVNGAKVAATDPSWPAQATAGFLGGRVGLPFTHDPNDPARDTIARLAAAGQAPLAVTDPFGAYTVDVRFAVHAGPLDLTGTAGVPPFVADDGQHALLAGSGFTMAQTDPAHPSNGAVPARYVLERLRSDLLDGGPDQPVAAVALSGTTTWLPVRVTMYGPALPAAVYGRLTTVFHDVERQPMATETGPVYDVAGARLPHHGVLILADTHRSGVGPERTLHLVGPVNDVVTAVNCTRVGSGSPPTFTITVADLPPDADCPRIALLPPATTMAELVTAAAPDIDTLLSSPRIQAGMADRYARVEAAIGPAVYPATWNQDPDVKPTTFHGARRPWSGVTSRFVQDLLTGVAGVSITAPHPPIRPADVFNTWLMEGLFTMFTRGLFGRFVPVLSSGTFRAVVDGWTDVAAVKVAVRVGLLWNFCGLDSFNANAGPAHDNRPTESNDPATMIQTHNAAFDRFRSGIVAQGVSCPTHQQVDATFSVALDAANHWVATPGAGYTATLAQLMAAGLYDHQMSYIANLRSFGVPLDPVADLPAAYRYLSYNAGPGSPASGGATWDTVDLATLDKSIRFYIEGLRDMTAQPGVWPSLNDWLATDPIGVGEESRTSGGARTNAIQFWLLTEEVGVVFPPELPPLP